MFNRKDAINAIFDGMAQAHCDYIYDMVQGDLPKSEAYVTAMLLSAQEETIIEFAKVYVAADAGRIRCNGMESYFITDDTGEYDVLKAVWWRKHNV